MSILGFFPVEKAAIFVENWQNDTFHGLSTSGRKTVMAWLFHA